MFASSTGKWLLAVGLLLAAASPAFAEKNTADFSSPVFGGSGSNDTAALLVAQLDSVAAFCSQRFPASRDQYKAFVNGILSGVSSKEIARIRDTQDYERAREWDMSQLVDSGRNNAAGTCSGL